MAVHVVALVLVVFGLGRRRCVPPRRSWQSLPTIIFAPLWVNLRARSASMGAFFYTLWTQGMVEVPPRGLSTVFDNVKPTATPAPLVAHTPTSLSGGTRPGADSGSPLNGMLWELVSAMMTSATLISYFCLAYVLRLV